jgi:predicted DNA-binding transcriptional regulator AlpA
MPRVFTADEIASVLNISPATLAGWRCVGRGPRYIKQGRFVRYREQDVDEWLQRQFKEESSRSRPASMPFRPGLGGSD